MFLSSLNTLNLTRWSQNHYNYIFVKAMDMTWKQNFPGTRLGALPSR